MRRFAWSILGSSSIMPAVSLNIFFGLAKLINLLSIRFNYFYAPKVIDIVIFSSSTDLLIWGTSILFIVSAMFLLRTLNYLDFPRWLIFLYVLLLASLSVFLINDRIALVFAVPLGFAVLSLSVYFGNGFLLAKKEETVLLTIIGVIGLLILFELASVSLWIVNAFNYKVPFGSDLRWRFPWIDLQLFNVLYPLIPFLFMILLYSWIWIPALRYLLSRIGRSINSGIQNVEKLNNRSIALGLTLCLAVSVFITCYPYIHLPDSTLIGVDSIAYYDWLKEMMQKGPQSAFDTDRPFNNLLMYFIKYVTPLSPQDVVRIMPIIASVCLSLAVFWFVKEGTGDEHLALLSSLFSSFSFQTTVSIFACYLANWFAIVETFLLMVFLLKSLNKHSWKYMLISAFIGIALLLTHPYTWNVTMAILTSYFAWALIRRSEEKWEIAPLCTLLVANVLFYMFYTLTPFGKGLGNQQGGVLREAASNVGIPSLSNLQNSLGLMVSMVMGGLYGNPLMIILAIAGMLSIINFTRPMIKFYRIVPLSVIIPSLTLLIISPGQVFLYRLIYLIPFQILAAIGLHSVFNWLKEVERKFKLKATHSSTFRILLFTLIVLFLLNYSLRSVDETMIYGNPTP